MVVLDRLTKSFGTLKALDGVSLAVSRGSCFGLLGPNGAGKSTTISIIVGGLKADAGTVTIDGHSLKGEADPLLKKIGYVPQEIALLNELKADQNLRFFGSLYDLAGAVLESRVQEVLEFVGLKDRAKEPVRNYSGGMKRRLNIAAALLHDPDLIILDEPTVGVDAQSRNAIFDTLEALKREGKTLIYTTHYMEEVERMCDRIAIIDHGKVCAEGTLEELLLTLPSPRNLILAFDSGEKRDRAVGLLGSYGARPINDTHVEAPVNDFGEAVISIVSSLQAAGLAPDDLSTRKGNLEQVFLNYTGRNIRD